MPVYFVSGVVGTQGYLTDGDVICSFLSSMDIGSARNRGMRIMRREASVDYDELRLCK